MHGYGFDMAWGGWWMLLFWLGVIGLVVWGVRLLFSDHRSSDSRAPETARQIAERRYARGEISREEFLDLINDLESVEVYGKAKRSER
ncbi:MAG: hypothetical protein Kow00106_17030 [Anaerolineae bacterium]